MHQTDVRGNWSKFHDGSTKRMLGKKTKKKKKKKKKTTKTKNKKKTFALYSVYTKTCHMFLMGTRAIQTNEEKPFLVVLCCTQTGELDRQTDKSNSVQH